MEILFYIKNLENFEIPKNFKLLKKPSDNKNRIEIVCLRKYILQRRVIFAQ